MIRSPYCYVCDTRISIAYSGCTPLCKGRRLDAHAATDIAAAAEEKQAVPSNTSSANQQVGTDRIDGDPNSESKDGFQQITQLQHSQQRQQQQQQQRQQQLKLDANASATAYADADADAEGNGQQLFTPMKLGAQMLHQNSSRPMHMLIYGERTPTEKQHQVTTTVTTCVLTFLTSKFAHQLALFLSRINWVQPNMA